jgi:hypothetical protein
MNKYLNAPQISRYKYISYLVFVSSNYFHLKFLGHPSVLQENALYDTPMFLNATAFCV